MPYIRQQIRLFFTGISRLHLTETLLLHLKSGYIKIPLRLQQFSAGTSELSRKKHKKCRILMSRNHLFLLFLHAVTVALHSGIWFSTVLHIIPAVDELKMCC